MDTKQKTRSAASQSSRRPASKAKKKKNTGLLGLLGGKPAKKPAPAKKQQPQRRKPTPEEIARRREAAERRAAAQQEAIQEETFRQDALAAQPEPQGEAIPEMVFKPGQDENLTPEEQKRADVRKRSAKRTKERKKEAKKAANRPNVTYTQPAPFDLQKLLLQLVAVVAVVLAIVMGLSIFFKVKHVVVFGNKAYSAWTIQEASGIEGGENLLSFGATRACGKITTALPYVDTVRIGIKLPDTVNIYIEEFDVVYAIKSGEGDWWLMTSGGKMVEKIDAGTAASYTKVLGVEVNSPMVGMDAKAVEVLVEAPQATDAEGETEEAVYTITGSDKLKAALMILEALERNDIVGEAASINVQSLSNLELMYGSRYQVKLGDTGNMEYKIASMKQAVAQLNEYQTGILDVSFTTWTDRPGYTPYE